VDQDVRVAVVGAGRWGQHLVRNLHDLGVLAAVADPDPAIRERTRFTYPDVKLLDDAASAASSDVEAVVIATPASTHAPLCIQALEAGKHVYVEKPFTLTVADAERVVEVAERAGMTLMVGHLLLYQPAVGFLRDYLASGAIGRVAFLHQDRLNLGVVRSAENALWSLGVHDVAAMLHIVGDVPTAVDAWGQRVLQPHVEDDVHLHMRFPGDTEGHLHASWLWPERRRRLTIVGTEAMVVYDEEGHEVVVCRRRAGDDLGVVDDGSEVLFTGDPAPLRHELIHFLNRVVDGAEPLSSGRAAIPVIRVLEESARQLARFGG